MNSRTGRCLACTCQPSTELMLELSAAARLLRPRASRRCSRYTRPLHQQRQQQRRHRRCQHPRRTSFGTLPRRRPCARCGGTVCSRQMAAVLVMQAVAHDIQHFHLPTMQAAPSAAGGWEVTWTTDAMDHDGAPITDVAFAPALKGLPGGDGHGGWLISVSDSMCGRPRMLPVVLALHLQQSQQR